MKKTLFLLSFLLSAMFADAYFEVFKKVCDSGVAIDCDALGFHMPTANV
jgi:hypothetical protein